MPAKLDAYTVKTCVCYSHAYHVNGTQTCVHTHVVTSTQLVLCSSHTFVCVNNIQNFVIKGRMIYIKDLAQYGC